MKISFSLLSLRLILFVINISQRIYYKSIKTATHVVRAHFYFAFRNRMRVCCLLYETQIYNRLYHVTRDFARSPDRHSDRHTDLTLR